MVDVRDEVIWDQWDIWGAWYSGDGIILVGLYFFNIFLGSLFVCVCTIWTDVKLLIGFH